MPAIIIGIIIIAIIGFLIYLYFSAIIWFFTTLAAEFIVIFAVVATAGVVFVYGKRLIKKFSKKSDVRLAFLVVPVCLLFFIYIDFVYLLSSVLRDSFNSTVGNTLALGLASFVAGEWLHEGGISHCFRWIPIESHIWRLVVGSSATKMIFVTLFCLLARGLSTDDTDGGQPAYIQYFHGGRAFRDLGEILRDTGEELWSWLEKAWGVIVAVVKVAHIFVWPIALVILVSFIPTALAALLIGLLLTVFHTMALAIAWSVGMLISLALSLTERAVILLRSGYARCPHAGCYASVALPVYHCPSCGQQHDRLVPGRYGIFIRRCECGTGRLPTIFWLGKRKLQASCPNPECRGLLQAELFGGKVHIPIYGPARSGKTMFLMASTWQLLEAKLPGVAARIIEKRTSDLWEKSWKPAFEAGTVREKTADHLPSAFMLSLQRKGGLPLSAYLYDPKGEVVESEDDLVQHHFLEYFDGLVFMLDPLALTEMFQRHLNQGGSKADAAGADLHVEDILDRVIQTLETKAHLSRHKKYTRRIAVVFSKADRPIVQQEWSLSLQETPNPAHWRETGEQTSARIRAWLQQYHQEFLQLLEDRFSDVRFFAVSSFGHAEAEGRGFRPREVLAPMMWLLSGRHALQRPRLHAWALRLGEVAVMVAMLGVLVGLPAAGLAWGVVPAVAEVLERPDGEGEFGGHTAWSSRDQGSYGTPDRSQPRYQPPEHADSNDGSGQDRNIAASVEPRPNEAPRPPDVRLLRPDHVRASSYLRSGRTRYPPEQAFDGQLEKAWAEGVRSAGSGEWIEAEFDSLQRIVRIELTTGYEKHHPRSGDLFYLNPHLRRLRLEVGGQTFFRDVGRDQRRLSIDGLNVTANKVRFVVDNVWNGTRWQDLSISEISIYGNAEATSSTAGRGWWCLCYSERINGRATPVTACRQSADQCGRLEAKVRRGSRQIIARSVRRSCREVVADHPADSLGAPHSWQPSAHEGGLWTQEGCLLSGEKSSHGSKRQSTPRRKSARPSNRAQKQNQPQILRPLPF